MRSIPRLLALVLACASSMVVICAEAQEALPKPGPEVQKLAVMVGRFTNEGEAKAGAFGPNSPAMKIKGIDECRWTADGFGLVCTETIDIGGRKGEDPIQFHDPQLDRQSSVINGWPSFPRTPTRWAVQAGQGDPNALA